MCAASRQTTRPHHLISLPQDQRLVHFCTVVTLFGKSRAQSPPRPPPAAAACAEQRCVGGTRASNSLREPSTPAVVVLLADVQERGGRYVLDVGCPSTSSVVVFVLRSKPRRDGLFDADGRNKMMAHTTSTTPRRQPLAGDR